MTIEEIIIHIFCIVDDRIKEQGEIVKHPQANQYAICRKSGLVPLAAGALRASSA